MIVLALYVWYHVYLLLLKTLMAQCDKSNLRWGSSSRYLIWWYKIVQYLAVVQQLREGYASSRLWFHTFAITLCETLSSITFTTNLIYWRDLEWNSTQRKSEILSVTPFRTSWRHGTLCICTSLDSSRILDATDVGDVIAVAVAVAVRDELAAAGDGLPAHPLNSWESHASFGSSNQNPETIAQFVRLLNQLLRDVIKADLFLAALIVERLCHYWECNRWVDPLLNDVADTIYLSGMNIWWGWWKIRIEMTKYPYQRIINLVIDVFRIALTLCSASWTKLWQDPKLASFQGQQTIVDAQHGEGNERRIDFINKWSVSHSHVSYAIEVCAVNKIHNFSWCKLKLALQNWSSRQRWDKNGTLILPQERLCRMSTCPWPIARPPYSRPPQVALLNTHK